MSFPPRAIVFGPVSCNVDSPMDAQRTVTISKFPGSQGNSENICNAETVTLATMDLADKMMPGYQENLDYEDMQNFVVSKSDRINIPFRQEWLKEKQKKMQESMQQENTGRPNHRPRRPESFFPRIFQSAILGARPEGRKFWLITGKTKFEFENTDIVEIFDPHRFRPKNLVNVIPISKQLQVEDTEFTIPSLEVYRDRMKLIWYSHQRVKIPESEFGDPLKMSKIQERIRINDSPVLVIEIKNDLGNQYSATNEGGGGGGGSSGPDPVTREIVSDFSWNRFFSPTLDWNAKEIIITIKEVHWLKRKKNAPDMMPSSVPQTEPPFMTSIEPKYLPKMVIAEGPWEYRIPIQQDNL